MPDNAFHAISLPILIKGDNAWASCISKTQHTSGCDDAKQADEMRAEYKITGWGSQKNSFCLFCLGSRLPVFSVFWFVFLFVSYINGGI